MENYTAYKYHEGVIDKIVSICEPLEHLGITTFGYHRIFHDGTYISFSNNLSWKKFYFEHVQQKPILWTECNFISKPKHQFDFISYLWPDTPKSLIGEYLLQRNIWNGFQFIKFSPDYFELWAVASTIENTKIKDFYLRHRDIILKFIHHFNARAADLIEVSKNDSHKLARYKYPVNYPDLSYLEDEEQSINRFLHAFNVKSAQTVYAPSGICSLSTREVECLNLIARGHSVKQVASELLISPRTAESHINNIKLKTGTYFRTDLVKLYENNFM